MVTTEDRIGRRQTIVRKGFHSLRHSFVSLAAASGVPQVVIQDLVGHGSAAMTAHYSHSSLAQKTAAIASIPEIGTPEAATNDKEKPPEQ